jgi:hypothetical protein
MSAEELLGCKGTDRQHSGYNIIYNCVNNANDELLGKFCTCMEDIFNDFLASRYSELANTSNILVKVLENNFVSARTPLDLMEHPDHEIMRICRLLLIKSFDYFTRGVKQKYSHPNTKTSQ